MDERTRYCRLLGFVAAVRTRPQIRWTVDGFEDAAPFEIAVARGAGRLRHPYATHPLQAGRDPMLVQQQVDHAYSSTPALNTSVPGRLPRKKTMVIHHQIVTCDELDTGKGGLLLRLYRGLAANYPKHSSSSSNRLQLHGFGRRREARTC